MRSSIKARACGTEAVRSLYEDITIRIVAELEAGRIPWVQPWGTAGAPVLACRATR